MGYQTEDELRRAVYGLAIGDALGVPYEFAESGSFECSDMVGFGVHAVPAGTWSDDTSMTIATTAALRERDGEIDTKLLLENYRRWLFDGAYTPDGVSFGIGRATFHALSTGVVPSRFEDNGNGALMRILPLAFTDADDADIDAVSTLTHGHGISKQACRIFVHTARRLIAGQPILEILPDLILGEPFHRLATLEELPASEVRTSGYVVDTLEAALWSLAQEALVADGDDVDHYANAVLRVINLGGDTDTIGAVTGGLAGIIYGMDGPTARLWMEKLRAKELIGSCI